MTSQLLLNYAERFNRAAALVEKEYASSICSSGSCVPSDRQEFNRLVKAKIASFAHLEAQGEPCQKYSFSYPIPA